MKPKRSRMGWQVGVFVARAVVIVGTLWFWQWAADTGVANPFLVSRPSAIAERIWDLASTGKLDRHVVATFQEAGLGFLVSAVAGTALGLLLSRARFVDEVTRPLLDVFNTLPRIALAPLFVLWFGLGFTAKIVLVTSVVIFAFVINTYSGVKSVNPDYVRMARSLGASREQVIRKIVIQSIVPWLFAAVRFGVAYSLATAVVGEIVSGNVGLGYLIAESAGLLDTTGVFSSLAILAVLAFIANTAMQKLEDRLLVWRKAEERALLY